MKLCFLKDKFGFIDLVLYSSKESKFYGYIFACGYLHGKDGSLNINSVELINELPIIPSNLE